MSMGPVADVLRKCGRNVSGTDFGHSAKMFQGVYAIGMFQLGSGAVIPTWVACFGGEWKTEDGHNWEWCAKQIKEAGLGDLYDNGHAHFHDRMKEAKFFEQQFTGAGRLHALNCARHILENARKAAPKVEKDWHPNMFWAVQGAGSESEYYVKLGAFKTNYPQTYDYLKAVPVETWVRYKQIEKGARTYGWRTSNLAEIGQSIAKAMRALHPLEFFEEMLSSAFGTLAKEMKNQKEWSVSADGKAYGLVPFATNRAKALAEAARHCTITATGPNQYRSQYFDGGSFLTHSKRSVNLARGICTCLEFQEYGFPCKDAFAAYQSEGRSWEHVVKSSDVVMDSSYKLLSADVLDAIVTQVVQPPQIDELEARRDPDYAAALAVRAAAAGIPDVRAPAPRVDEAHGNSKHARKKRRTDGAASRGRTSSRSFATTQAEKQKSRLWCSKCRAAGRDGEEAYKHRGSNCPFEVSVVVDSDEDDGDDNDGDNYDVPCIGNSTDDDGEMDNDDV